MTLKTDTEITKKKIKKIKSWASSPHVYFAGDACPPEAQCKSFSLKSER